MLDHFNGYMMFYWIVNSEHIYAFKLTGFKIY